MSFLLLYYIDSSNLQFKFLTSKMSIRKRNEFLDGDESDDDVDHGYDSDAAEESRGVISGRASKRRKFEAASDDESLDGIEEDGQQRQPAAPPRSTHEKALEHQIPNDVEDEDQELNQHSENQTKSTQLKKSTPKEATAAQKAARKSGVIYISRIPPFMKPQTLKHFLTPHAPSGLGRIFLTPEDHTAHTRRVKSGGNKKKSYTDGWVEFISKREAKVAAEMLNGNIIGGKKGGWYHDDLWNMKYLRGFKWAHLTEQISIENAERAARMREEVRKTRVENRHFVEDVERGKMMERMEGKRKAREGKGGLAGGDEGGRKVGRAKEFKQKSVQVAREREKPSEQVSRMQRMIF